MGESIHKLSHLSRTSSNDGGGLSANMYVCGWCGNRRFVRRIFHGIVSVIISGLVNVVGMARSVSFTSGPTSEWRCDSVVKFGSHRGGIGNNGL